MAVLANGMGQQEEENQQGVQAQGAQQAPSLGGGEGGLISGGGGGAAGLGPARRSRQGGFVGIQQYLQAQSGAGGRLAENLTGELGQRGENVKSSIGGLEQAFEQGAQSGRAGDASRVVEGIRQDPTKVSADDYRRATQGYYGGPSSLTELQGYGQTAEQIRGLGQQLEQTKSSAGQEALLRDVYGRPQYTQGQSRLDVALLRGTPEAREQFAGIREQLGGLGGQLSQAEAQAQARAQSYGQEAVAAKSLAEQALASERQGLQSGVDQRLAQEQALRDEIAKNTERSIYGDVGSVAKQNALNQFGLSKEDQKYLSKDDLSKLLQHGRGLTREDVVKEEERARIQALEGLAGPGTASYLRAAPTSALNPGVMLDVQRARKIAAANKAVADADRAAKQLAAAQTITAPKKTRVVVDDAPLQVGVAALSPRELTARELAAIELAARKPSKAKTIAGPVNWADVLG